MAKKDLNFLCSAPIAHRGLHGLGVPENSLAAFGAAVAHGYIIELDVHLLSDGEIVVFHDDNLERMCGISAEVKSLTKSSISKYRLANTREHIPLLKDVLSLIDGAVPLIIELKGTGVGSKFVNALWGALKDYRGEYALKSFNPLVVRNLRRRFRSAPVGQLFSSSMFGDLPRLTGWMFRRVIYSSLRRCDFVSVNYKDLNLSTIASLRRCGKLVLAWTIRSEGARRSALKKADNCICEKII